MRKIERYAIRLLGRLRARDKKTADDGPKAGGSEEGNPYLPQIREIMEQILKKRKIPYGQFSPIVIDGADSKETLMAVELLGKDLNRLLLLTDRPAYFEAFADNMYEEQGLIAEILPKDRAKLAALSGELQGNVILDFEKPGDRGAEIKFGGKIYIPIFKRRWEAAKNLDIAVPIGYNTVTVKGCETVDKQPYRDKFEKAFYENI